MPLHSPHSIKKNSYFYRELLFPHSYSVGGRNKIVAKYCYSKSGLVSNATEMKSEQEQDKKKNEIRSNEKKLLSQIGFGISELSIKSIVLFNYGFLACAPGISSCLSQSERSPLSAHPAVIPRNQRQ